MGIWKRKLVLVGLGTLGVSGLAVGELRAQVRWPNATDTAGEQTRDAEEAIRGGPPLGEEAAREQAQQAEEVAREQARQREEIAREQAEGGEQTARERMGVEQSELRSTTGTVGSVDLKNRTVTLIDAEGDRFTVDVPTEMKGIDRLRKGDTVDLAYYEAVALSVLPPGQVVEPGLRTEGRICGREVSKQMTATATIIAVDAGKNTIKYRGADGKTQSVKIEDPELRAKLADLNPGDTVQIVYSEAVAASLELRLTD